jgi:hypothetical protein
MFKEEDQKNIIFCDGGLSNRLNSLIYGLILKNRYNQEWLMSWPVNNWCGISFDKLFSINMDVQKNNLLYFKKIEELYLFIVHENQIKLNEKNIKYINNINSYQQFENILTKGKKIFYYNNLIPNFVKNQEIVQALGEIKLNKNIQNIAKGFCQRNAIDEGVIGLHIRMTDFGNLIDTEYYFKMIQESNKRFFVCSDDETLTNKFSMLPNCHVFEKENYPTKYNQKYDWNEEIVDDQERNFNFNINRSADSVVEALIDLLILSKTTQLKTSNSTFLNMANLFKKANFLSN